MQVNAGANITIRNKGGRTALFLVTGSEGKFGLTFPPYCLRCAKMLIEAGADVNAVGNAGNTPLILAARAENPLPIVRLLVKAGANVDYCNPETGITALNAARKASNTAVVNYLKSHGAEARPDRRADDKIN
ncbi:MAG: ankyrin repeat domain-containing protein [Gammaproteobacteria bacterium]|nr:ankyrin repeat domain-containing protein [Gammaproteobacteria bacterium]